MKNTSIFKTISIVIGICVGLAMAELCIRVAMPRPLYYPRIKTKELVYKNYRGDILWEFTDSGSVDIAKSVKEAAMQKDSFRIVGLGDSVMNGITIPRKYTYIARLGSALEKTSGRKTVVANLSQPGYNLKQESAMFEMMGVKAKPNLVIVHSWEDDLDEYLVVGGIIYGADVYSKTGVVRTIPLPSAVNEYLILHSRLYQSLSLLAIMPKETRADEIRRGSATCKQSLESLYKNARKSDAAILILLSPSLAGEKIQPFKRTPDKHAFYYMVTDWARSRNVDVIDLTEKMAGVDTKPIRVDDVHFNRKGHDLILKILSDYIPARYMKQSPALTSR